MNQADLTDRILMIIGDLTINGTTRLQKYGFLLHMKHGHDLKTISKTQKELEFYSDWKPYWYGPYSPGLQKDAYACAENGMAVQIEMDSYLKLKQYSLTAKGRVRWRQIREQSPGAMRSIENTIRGLQKISLDRLLRGVYLEYPEYAKRSTIKDRLDS